MGLSRGSGGAVFDAAAGSGNNPGVANHGAVGQAPVQAHTADTQMMYGAAMPQHFGYNLQGIGQPMPGAAPPAAFFNPYNAAVQGQMQTFDGLRAMDMALGIAGVT